MRAANPAFILRNWVAQVGRKGYHGYGSGKATKHVCCHGVVTVVPRRMGEFVLFGRTWDSSLRDIPSVHGCNLQASSNLVEIVLGEH